MSRFRIVVLILVSILLFACASRPVTWVRNPGVPLGELRIKMGGSEGLYRFTDCHGQLVVTPFQAVSDYCMIKCDDLGADEKGSYFVFSIQEETYLWNYLVHFVVRKNPVGKFSILEVRSWRSARPWTSPEMTFTPEKIGLSPIQIPSQLEKTQESVEIP